MRGKPRIKVAQVITGLGTGGAERMVLNLAKALDPETFEVRILSLTDDLSALQVYGHADTQVHVVDLRRLSRASGWRAVRAALSQFAADVIHAHMFHALIATTAVLPGLSKRPAICFTSHLNPYPPLRAAATAMLRPVRETDIVFVEDQHPGINAKHTVVIPNGVPFGPMPERRPWSPGRGLKLLAVGRIADQKDPIGMLDSFKAAEIPGSALEFAGDGPLMEQARAHAAELGLAGRVTFHGVTSQTERLMREADVLVMHSKYEGMPMALLEGAAMALPVISTPVGAAQSVLGVERGFVAPVEQFPEVLRQVASSPERSIAMARNLYDYARERYSLDATTALHAQVYERAAAKAASR